MTLKAETFPDWLTPEGDLPQEVIPGENYPPLPEVQTRTRPMQPQYWTGSIPFAPAIVKLELDREARHLAIRFVGYVDPPYPNLFSADLAWFWGQPSTLGGVLQAGETFIMDDMTLVNTVLFLQARTPAAGAGALLLIAEVYYW